MRFSIRDLLWATLVVAMALGWWVSYRAMAASRTAAAEQAGRHKVALEMAVRWVEHYGIRYIEMHGSTTSRAFNPRWLREELADVLSEPLVEP